MCTFSPKQCFYVVFGTKMITLAQNRIYATKGHNNGVNIHLLPDRNEVKLTTVCLKLLFHIFCCDGGILVFVGCLAALLRDITIIFIIIII